MSCSDIVKDQWEVKGLYILFCGYIIYLANLCIPIKHFLFSWYHILPHISHPTIYTFSPYAIRFVLSVPEWGSELFREVLPVSLLLFPSFWPWPS